MKKVKILDATLREGEQAVGVCFSLSEKIKIANCLQEFGVDIIEIGHPGISKQEEIMCRSICEAVSGIEILAHARARESDILAAVSSKATWVGIWASYNDISLSSKFNNKSREWIKEQVSTSILLAKEKGLKVRFTIEDASRTSIELIDELAKVAISAGADRISLADTVGAWHPNECFKMIDYAVTHFNSEIEVHLHNDLGLAQANAISAIEAGASVIDVSVLGIGERAGICDLFSTSLSLEKLYGMGPYHLKKSMELSTIVSRIAGFVSEPHHPVIGRQVFTHVSKYHIKATEKNSEAYEFLNPEDFDVERKNKVNLLDRGEAERFSNEMKVKKPFIKGASELKYHRDGVGNRWVFMDNRIDERSLVYIIERIFDKDYEGEYQPHVDPHRHHCDSVFVFMGDQPDGTGLTVSVTLGEGNAECTQIIESPASVFIPAQVLHYYAYIKGMGRFLNFVMAPNYNESLS